MSIHDNAQNEKKDAAKRKRERPLPWAADESSGELQDWESVDPLLIAYVVASVGGGGGSVQFTVARDGGALGVRVYVDGAKPKTQWGRLNDDLEEQMFAIADYFRAEAGKDKLRW